MNFYEIFDDSLKIYKNVAMYYYSISLLFFISDIFFQKLGILHKVKYYSKNEINYELYKKSFLTTLKVFTYQFPSMILLYVFTSNYLEIEKDFDFTFNNAIKFISLFLLEDFFFYYLHLLFHTKFYKYHKTHHELVENVAVGALYSEIYENIIVNIFPIFIIPIVLKLPLELAKIWFNFALINSIISHSGYRLPFVKFHDDHHKYRNCNYGVLGFFDKLNGTYKK